MKVIIDPHLDDLTGRIIGAAFTVSNTLGHGFLESVYKNALVEELLNGGMRVAKEKAFRITYREKDVGLYVADLVVEDAVIIELKAIDALSSAHRAQLLNYLSASGLPVGLLMNFGRPRLEVRRVIR
ncbi:MAG: GxxExxY protein [Alphaproteobacteria bacterium]